MRFVQRIATEKFFLANNDEGFKMADTKLMVKKEVVDPTFDGNSRESDKVSANSSPVLSIPSLADAQLVHTPRGPIPTAFLKGIPYMNGMMPPMTSVSPTNNNTVLVVPRPPVYPPYMYYRPPFSGGAIQNSITPAGYQALDLTVTPKDSAGQGQPQGHARTGSDSDSGLVDIPYAAKERRRWQDRKMEDGMDLGVEDDEMEMEDGDKKNGDGRIRHTGKQPDSLASELNLQKGAPKSL